MSTPPPFPPLRSGRRRIHARAAVVGQLAGLFWDLEHADVPAVTPSIELAKLALVTSKDEDEDADADADADRGGTDSSHDTEATLVDDAPASARAPASSASSPPGETGEPASASVSASSVLGKRARDREQEGAGAQMDVDAGSGSGSPAAVPSSSRVGAGAGADDDAEMLDAPAAEGRVVQKQQQPPSLPTRKAASESVMMFGTSASTFTSTCAERRGADGCGVRVAHRAAARRVGVHGQLYVPDRDRAAQV